MEISYKYELPGHKDDNLNGKRSSRKDSPQSRSVYFIVKNLFELKNAQRALFEGDILENTWGGFSQPGFAILLTAKKQFMNGINICPLCQVTDVTIRYTTISHVPGGLQITNAAVGHTGASAGERYSIHDVVVDDINGIKYLGPSLFAQLSSSPGVSTA